MRKRHPYIAVFVVAAVCAAFGAPPVEAAAAKKEKQSVITDRDGKELTSSALIKLLNQKFDGVYQDLELVITSCGGGEFASRGAGLKGQWSVSTATDTAHCNSTRYGNPDPKVGGKDGLKIGDTFWNGWNPQYIKKLLADGNAATNKQLFDAATANRGFKGDAPQYNSSGGDADNMTVHGGEKSNHAIVFNSATFHDIEDAWVDGLNKAGYSTSGTVEVFDSRKDAAHKPTFANLDTALDAMLTQLKANPGKEKAYINLNTHGSYGEKTIAYRDGQLDEIGGGVVVTSTSSPLPIFVDDTDVLKFLQEELPKSGGGFWTNDSFMRRAGLAVFSFSTISEDFPAPGDVVVSFDGHTIGTITMGNSTGGDYQLVIPDAVLDQIMSDILLTGLIDVGFTLPSAVDSFQLAVFEDWAVDTYSNLDYGVTIAANITAAVPEPGPLSFLFPALAAFGLCQWRWRPRRSGCCTTQARATRPAPLGWRAGGENRRDRRA